MSKGLIADVFLIGIFVVALAIFAVVGFYVLDAIRGTTLYTDYSFTHLDSGKDTIASFDNIILIGATIMAMVSLGLALIIPSHPFFVFAAIISLVIGTIVTPQFSNLYANVTSDSSFDTIAEDHFPKTTLFIGKLPLILAAFGMLLLVVQYAKA